jgi:multiple sugar transport system permease protein
MNTAPPKKRLALRLVPYLFIGLPLAYLAVVVLWPLLRELWISLTDTKLLNPNGGSFVGLDNFTELFADPALGNSLRVTVVYTLGTVVFAVLFGVITALAINNPFPGRTVARSILLFGWAVPNVAASLIWLWMFNEKSGVFNALLGAIGVEPQSWLTSPDRALWSILIATIWQSTPFVMLVVLAALQSVPSEVLEAATVDNADALSRFRAVTFPHIKPAIALVALLVTVWSIRRFEIIYLLTGGGPVGSTSTLVVSLRQEAFENYDLGMGAAYGVIGLALSLVVTAVYYLLERRDAKKSTL